MSDNKFLIGLWNDEEDLLHAIGPIKKSGASIYDALTPFPVHGLEHALELKDSRLHTAGFIYGATGMATALVIITWITNYSWPLIIGGKPFFSLPAWIPITFELTVLFAAVGMVFTFMIRNNLGPGAKNRIYDRRITDDKFALVFEVNDDTDTGKIEKLLKDNGAVEIHHRTVEPTIC